MARWRLINPHYLNVPGTEWEYKETDRGSGRQGRKLFPVPLYLNPNDPSDCNYPGEIIVANKESRAYPKDIIFLGDPTPEMEPVDEEAIAISDSFAPKWVHPIDSLPGTFSQSLLTHFEAQLAAAMTNNPIPIANPVSVVGIDKSRLDALEAQVAALMARNAELEAAKPEPKAALRRA